MNRYSRGLTRTGEETADPTQRVRTPTRWPSAFGAPLVREKKEVARSQAFESLLDAMLSVTTYIGRYFRQGIDLGW